MDKPTHSITSMVGFFDILATGVVALILLGCVLFVIERLEDRND